MRGGQDGLTYDTVAIGDLVNKDTDGDGILDWEEPLWGLDPTKMETTPGVPDSSVIKKLKAEQGFSVSATNEGSEDYTENLTETDKFSRELFSTIASLSQNGSMDQVTAEQISAALTEKMKNSTPQRTFTLSDIKIIKNDLPQTIKNYGDNLNKIYAQNPIKGNAVSILQRFIIDENNVDTTVLKELDPIIKQTQIIINNILKIDVPESLVSLHLDFLNGTERVLENLINIQFYDRDIILALGGISQYENNSTILESALENLSTAINQKLNN